MNLQVPYGVIEMVVDDGNVRYRIDVGGRRLLCPYCNVCIVGDFFFT